MKNENENEWDWKWNEWKIKMNIEHYRELFAFKKMNITTKPIDKTDGCLFQKPDREIS